MPLKPKIPSRGSHTSFIKPYKSRAIPKSTLSSLLLQVSSLPGIQFNLRTHIWPADPSKPNYSKIQLLPSAAPKALPTTTSLLPPHHQLPSSCEGHIFIMSGEVTCLGSAELVSQYFSFFSISILQSECQVAQENQIQLTGLIAIKPLLESGLCSLGLERNSWHCSKISSR